MIALDLFAGTGWGVAAKELGIHELGVEIMPEAIATRDAAGMVTVYRDVWDGLEDDSLVPEHDLVIASPPCPTFSPGGLGVGRAAIGNVIALIESGAWLRGGSHLRDAAAKLDPRTALVLTPLAYVARHRPTYVALEQVSTVLPVWLALADALASLGYSTHASVVSAEEHGVPQTRRRAILVARRDGVRAALPAPTHEIYQGTSRPPLDVGVLPWVSSAEALGISPDGVMGFPRRADSSDVVTLGGTDYRARDLRRLSAPAQTVTEKIRSWSRWTSADADPVRVTAQDAAVLQTFPRDFPFQGSKSRQFLQIANAMPPLLGRAVLETFL